MIMEVLATMALPHVLNAAYSALTMAWGQCESVKEQKAQCTTLLRRCTDLFLAVAKQSNLNVRSNNHIRAHVRFLERACITVEKTIATLASNGFAWRLLHQSDVRMTILSAESVLQTACDQFNINAHLSAHRLQIEMTAAKERDEADLVARMDILARNDQLILNALQDGDQRCRRLEELVIAFTKYLRRASNPDSSQMDVFIRFATSALHRLSGTSSAMEIPHWSLTSLEVTIDTAARLGIGNFGCVYKGNWSGQVVAVKEMHPRDARLLEPESLVLIRREIKIWYRLAHPHILPFYGACVEASQPFIVSKLCPNGNIIQYLTKFPCTDRIRLLHEMVLGMTYLHGLGIIHSDLKGVNILVDDAGKALIGDFRLAKLQDELSTVGRGSSARAVEGSMRWMAPERLDGKPLDFPSDIYSFGVTAWELFSGEIPFAGVLDRVLHRLVVDKHERPSRPDTLVSNPLWNLVKRCWRAEPQRRPTFMTIHADIKRLMDSDTGTLSDEVPEPEHEEPSTSMRTVSVTVDNQKITVAFDSQKPLGNMEGLLTLAALAREKKLGAEHRETLEAMDAVASIYAQQHRYGDAERLFMEVLAGREKVLGTEHGQTLKTMHSLASVYRHQLRYDDSETLFRLAVAGRERVLGAAHEDTLISMQKLACVYADQQRYRDSEVLFKRVLTYRERTLGIEHKDTLTTMHLLASAYRDQRLFRDAETIFKRVLVGREKVLGTDHEDTMDTMRCLARIYKKQRRHSDAAPLLRRVSARESRTQRA